MLNIAIANMANDWCEHALPVQVRPGRDDTFGQRADRDTDICDPAFTTRSHCSSRVVRIVSCLPKPSLFFCKRGPDEVVPAVLGGKGRHPVALLCY